MEEKEQFISNLKRQMQELEDEHKTKLESCEREIHKLKWNIEELENELEHKKEAYEQYYLLYHSLLEKENEGGDELVEMLDKLSKIIGKTVDKPCSDIKETERLNRVETKMLIVNKLTSMKRMLMGNVSNEPDNVPQPKRNLSRSLSIDEGYGSDKENCDNDLSSNISPISSIEKVAKSRNVEVA